MANPIFRRADAGDRGRLLVMARAFHVASGLPLPFSGPAISILIDACMTAPNRLMLVMDVDGVARGFLAAEAGPHPFAGVTIATELAWWVEPAYRGAAALGMLGAYEEWARGAGCAAIHLAGLGGDPAVSTVYRRRGYRPAETHFLKIL